MLFGICDWGRVEESFGEDPLASGTDGDCTSERLYLTEEYLQC